MQANLVVAGPKIRVWHKNKWEFCQKYPLWGWIHCEADEGKPFLPRRSCSGRGRTRVWWRRAVPTSQGQKLMGSSCSSRKREPEIQVIPKAWNCPITRSEGMPGQMGVDQMQIKSLTAECASKINDKSGKRNSAVGQERQAAKN